MHSIEEKKIEKNGSEQKSHYEKKRKKERKKMEMCARVCIVDDKHI